VSPNRRDKEREVEYGKQKKEEEEEEGRGKGKQDINSGGQTSKSQKFWKEKMEGLKLLRKKKIQKNVPQFKNVCFQIEGLLN
jgi:hypothetical protein